MIRITALHRFEESKVNAIMKEMQTLGQPTIKYVGTYLGNIALEGTHRLEAAYRLGIMPHFVEKKLSDIIDHDIDLLHLNSPCSVGELIEHFIVPQGKFYDFEEGLKKYAIFANGISMGTYKGFDENAAKDTFAKDAGYKNCSDMLRQISGSTDHEITIIEVI